MADDTGLLKLLGERNLGVLATLKRDGRPQLSNVSYLFEEDRRLVRVSISDGRAKTYNLRRDPRASLHVSSQDGWSYAVAEGDVELSAVAADPQDEAVDELVEHYRAIRGEHPDWDDFRRAMVAEKRLIVRLHVTHLYGLARG